jgi:hypothetical protein
LDVIPELEESASTTTLHYLKGVVAWHDALHHLCAKSSMKQAMTNSVIGLVEVPHGASSVLTADELIEMFQCGLDFGKEDIKQMVDHLGKQYSPSFPGTVHAEATLMGLLAYNHYNQHSKYTSEIECEGLLNELLGTKVWCNFSGTVNFSDIYKRVMLIVLKPLQSAENAVGVVKGLQCTSNIT